MNVIRCQNCNRKLLEVGSYDELSIKCRRCRHFNHFKSAKRTLTADQASFSKGKTLEPENPLVSPATIRGSET